MKFYLVIFLFLVNFLRLDSFLINIPITKSDLIKKQQKFLFRGGNSIDSNSKNTNPINIQHSPNDLKRSPLSSIFQLLFSTTNYFKPIISLLTDDIDVIETISKVISFSFWCLVGISLLGTIGIDTKPIVSLVGVLGITFGLAIKDLITNAFAGFYILFTRPFSRGDIITINDMKGKVLSIDFRFVRLQALNGKGDILIPSSKVYGATIIIESS